MTQTAYVSFLVRLWRDGSRETSDLPADWNGEIEHIQSGRQWAFGTLNEMLAFLRRQVEDPSTLEMMNA